MNLPRKCLVCSFLYYLVTTGHFSFHLALCFVTFVCCILPSIVNITISFEKSELVVSLPVCLFVHNVTVSFWLLFFLVRGQARSCDCGLS